MRLRWSRKAAIWLAALGAALAVAGVVMLTTANAGWKETTATVLHVDETLLNAGQENEQAVYSAFVEYTVDGRLYTEVDLGVTRPEYRKGASVAVLYDVADPARAKPKGQGGFGVYAVGLSALLLILAATHWVKGGLIRH